VLIDFRTHKNPILDVSFVDPGGAVGVDGLQNTASRSASSICLTADHVAGTASDIAVSRSLWR